MRYIDIGAGEVVVLLNGLSRTSSEWYGFESALAKKCRVIAPDNRGMTVGQKIDWKTSVFDMADDTVELMDQLNVDKFHIVGLSLGGMIAMAMAIKYPQRVQTLNVINTSFTSKHTTQISLAGSWAMLKSAIAPQNTHRYMQNLLAPNSFYTSHPEITESTNKIHAAEGYKLKTAIVHLKAALNLRIEPELEKLNVPTLIIFGSKDLLVPPKNAQKLYEIIPNSRLVEVENGTHEMTLTHADTICDIISENIQPAETAA